MKLAVIRGTCLNQWEMQPYVRLGERGFSVSGICAEDNEFSLKNVGIPVIKLKRFKKAVNLPGISDTVSYFLCCNNCLVGLDKVLKNFDAVNTVENYNTFSYKAIKSGKPVFV